MKKLFSFAIYSLLLINAQRFNSNLHATEKAGLKQINMFLASSQEDAKGKAGVS